MVKPSTSTVATTHSQSGPTGPIRTCVGCRERAARSDLVRVALDGTTVVIDESATLPGRGAWLHRRPECLDLAITRRAFSRAFRAGEVHAGSLSLG